MKKYTESTQFKSTYLLESFSDYFEILKEISMNEKNKILWYRGQFDCAWHLTPNLFRYSKETADYMGREIDPLTPKFHFSSGYKVEFPNFCEELENFKTDIINEHSRNMYIPKNDFEWLFLGQHYGLLTPLVDFSTDPLIALFFALNENLPNKQVQTIEDCSEQFYENGYSDDCAAVFVLLPEEFNKLSPLKELKNGKYVDISRPITIGKYKTNLLDSYVTRDNVCFDPICFIAPKTNYRIIRQSGNFLCYGENIEPIDYRTGYKNTLYKIYIPHCIFPDMKNMLTVLDLTHSSIYGEDLYDDVAKKCKTIAKEKFDNAIKEYSKKIRIQEHNK